MKLEGIHHITAITEDAQRNVDFYAGVLGLRLVKKTVNQDNPTVYHLFFADEAGDAGSDLTFFEYPGAPLGRAGAGMVHRIVWRVASAEALDFWAERLRANDTASERDGDGLVFSDPEGLEHELLVVDVPDQPLIADHPEVPGEMALQGFHAVRAYARLARGVSSGLLEALEFEQVDGAWEARGEQRGGRYLYDEPPAERGLQGAGSVHHVAWASTPEELLDWREKAVSGGAQPTPEIDRFYFRSIYFREPSGVLFEIATLGPGFTVDEPLEHLGEKLSLPPDFEHLRDEVEPKPAPGREPAPEDPGLTDDFTWRDAGRTVVFRRGGVGGAVEVLREQGVGEFELLSTERALGLGRPVWRKRRAGFTRSRRGRSRPPQRALTDALAPPSHAEEGVRVRPLVALGGGRVIDVAKAVAAISGAEVVAIPTTMSGAEMTGIHRLPAGAEERARGMVRPSLVIADPEAMTASRSRSCGRAR